MQLIRTKHLARPADGVVCRMIETIVVVNVCPDFRRKKLVAYGVSLVRALPFNQVKSAKAKGSSGEEVLVPPALPFSVAWPACGPIAGWPKLEFALEIVFAGATVDGVAAVAPGVAA